MPILSSDLVSLKFANAIQNRCTGITKAIHREVWNDNSKRARFVVNFRIVCLYKILQGAAQTGEPEIPKSLYVDRSKWLYLYKKYSLNWAAVVDGFEN